MVVGIIENDLYQVRRETRKPSPRVWEIVYEVLDNTSIPTQEAVVRNSRARTGSMQVTGYTVATGEYHAIRQPSPELTANLVVAEFGNRARRQVLRHLSESDAKRMTRAFAPTDGTRLWLKERATSLGSGSASRRS